MKPATLAPVYATLYPGLCDVARLHGYALAIHGSLQRDLDLIAIPWIELATAPETLVAAINAHLNACGMIELMERNLGRPLTDSEIDSANLREREPAIKPHGRRAWSSYLPNGFQLDLGIMPLQPAS